VDPRQVLKERFILINERAEEILWYWFGRLDAQGRVPSEKMTRWFRGGKEVDDEIAALFDEDVEMATAGELDAWQEHPRSALALVLLLDQFPRNLYRGQPASFAADPKALSLALHCLEQGFDQKLPPIFRVFLYLPLEHAEDLERQEQCVALFQELAQQASPDEKALYENFLDFAIQHRDLIARFGRFPYRNNILGRENTPEEDAFLNETKLSFV
jgi:uncharacterized protein (DUF924 family)